jgi:LysR family positive regulator for ilvC
VDHEVLKMFLRLSNTLNFGRASRECHISTSKLSRSIKRLEDEIGWPLFDRNQRGVALTPEGERFRQFAIETLENWERFQRSVGQEGQITGSISIYASVTACNSFLPSLLERFRERHPGVHIKLETGDASNALGMLKEGSVDFTVAPVPEKIPKGVVMRLITRTPLILVAPARPCAVTRALNRTPWDWEQIPVVLPRFGLAREHMDAWFRAKEIRPQIYSEVAGAEGILSLISLGCGVGVVPQLVLDKSPLRSELQAIDVHPQIGEFRVSLCTRKNKLETPQVKAFWEVFDPASV